MDKETFYAGVRESFGALNQAQVDGIEAILTAWYSYGDNDGNKLAYILASAWHESDRFRTMEEYASGRAYEGREDLGNTQPGDGVRFKGRGFVQITGRRNYSDWSKRLQIDLVADPERAADREIAARIIVEGMMLGTFTGKKLIDYINASKVDFFNARRTVNGTDKAKLIADYALQFWDAIDAAAEAPPLLTDLPQVHSIDARVAALEERMSRMEQAAQSKMLTTLPDL